MRFLEYFVQFFGLWKTLSMITYDLSTLGTAEQLKANLKILNLDPELPCKYENVENAFKSLHNPESNVKEAFAMIQKLKNEASKFILSSPYMNAQYQYDGSSLYMNANEFFSDLNVQLKLDAEHAMLEQGIFINYPTLPRLTPYKGPVTQCSDSETGTSRRLFKYTKLKSCIKLELHGVDLFYVIDSLLYESFFRSEYKFEAQMKVPLALCRKRSCGLTFEKLVLPSDMNYKYRLNDNFDVYVWINSQAFVSDDKISISDSYSIPISKLNLNNQVKRDVAKMFSVGFFGLFPMRKPINSTVVFHLPGYGIKTRKHTFTDVYLAVDVGIVDSLKVTQ